VAEFPEPVPSRSTDVAADRLDPWMRDAATKITEHARGKTRAWDRLAHLVDHHPARLSGSRALEDAIDWAVTTMTADGLHDVRREKVMVPHWERGRESLKIVAPFDRELTVLGLGMSIGTQRPVRAEVVVVDDVDAIAGRDDIEGKVVLINQAMPPYDRDKDDSGYGTAVQARSRGAVEAGKKGARAVLVRSVTAHSLSTPHTGALRYEDGVKKIPAAAVTTEGAELLARMVQRGRVTVELRMGARQRPDAVSANAIAEIPGREKPDEVVLIGGHIDSWDVGDGAHDDGSGCLMAMEAALMLTELGLVPRRTIRVVLFTNEENGLGGALAYFDAHGRQVHAAAIEADAGAGEPQGFSIAHPDDVVVETIVAWAPLFEGLGAARLRAGWGGADIGPLMQVGVPGIAMRPDGSRYFDVHHSPADTIDKVDPDHLQRNAAAMALMAYLLAEAESLPWLQEDGPS
jgi:carboxypeptidase Q